jgi:hypothetical protein
MEPTPSYSKMHDLEELRCGREKENALDDGCAQYPANVIPEPAAVNLQYYNDKIADLRSSIFSESSSDTDVEITDITCKIFNSSWVSSLTEPSSHRRSNHSIQNTISYEQRC